MSAATVSRWLICSPYTCWLSWSCGFKLIPGCRGQAHTTIENGGHFLQEDQGEALARVVVEIIAANPNSSGNILLSASLPAK